MHLAFWTNDTLPFILAANFCISDQQSSEQACQNMEPMEKMAEATMQLPVFSNLPEQF